MSLSITVTGKDQKELLSQLKAAVSIVGGTSAAATTSTGKAAKETASDDTPSVSKNDVASKMQAVVEAKGMDEMKKILKKVKAAKLSEIKDADYEKVIKLCDESLGGGDDDEMFS